MNEKYIDKHEDDDNFWAVLSLLILNKSKIIVIIVVTFIASLLINQYTRTVLYDLTYKIDKEGQLQFIHYQPYSNFFQDNGVIFNVNSQNVFDLFVKEFSDYDEVENIIKNLDSYQKLTINLDDIDKKNILYLLKKNISIKPKKNIFGYFSSSDNKQFIGDWVIEITWPDKDEGEYISEMLVKDVLESVRDNITQLFLTSYNNEMQMLQLDLELIQEKQSLLDERLYLSKLNRMIYLENQIEIAKTLEIKNDVTIGSNFIDSKMQSSGEKFEFNIGNYDGTPFYFRGYLAIDKELEILKMLSLAEQRLQSSDHIDLLIRIKQIGLLKDRMILFKNNLTNLLINDDIKNWMNYNSKLSISSDNSVNLIFLFLVSVIFGTLIGSLYIIISSGYKKFKVKISL